MKTLREFSNNPPSALPMVTACLLSDLAEARGRQELFTKQYPQRLKRLRESALIESAISSNRIEGVEVDQKRIGTLMFGKPELRDRGEAEVRGYRDALKLIHDNGAALPISEETTLRLHATSRGDSWDAGNYKDRDIDIVETYPDGRSRVRSRPVPAAETPAAMKELFGLWDRGRQQDSMPRILLAAALNLDFLCIHPFRDGNGRVSRLLLLQCLYHAGFEVGRYISIERLIEQNKERYYETLEMSSHRWHEGKHDPWPYFNFLLFTFKVAYKEFELRSSDPIRGEKTESILAAIMRQEGEFKASDIMDTCHGVSVDLVRMVLKRLRGDKVECLGRGPNARWRRIG